MMTPLRGGVAELAAELALSRCDFARLTLLFLAVRHERYCFTIPGTCVYSVEGREGKEGREGREGRERR